MERGGPGRSIVRGHGLARPRRPARPGRGRSTPRAPPRLVYDTALALALSRPPIHLVDLQQVAPTLPRARAPTCDGAPRPARHRLDDRRSGLPARRGHRADHVGCRAPVTVCCRCAMRCGPSGGAGGGAGASLVKRMPTPHLPPAAPTRRHHERPHRPALVYGDSIIAATRTTEVTLAADIQWACSRR